MSDITHLVLYSALAKLHNEKTTITFDIVFAYTLRYESHVTIDYQKLYTWYADNKSPAAYGEKIASSRDIFQARLDSMLRLLLKKNGAPNVASLMTAVIGELGNNCYDHNLGQWRDSTGCWFEYDLHDDCIDAVIADRGQGIFSSIRRVDKTIIDTQTAIETAFSKVLSGRYPERRGNGLKFVRQAINGLENRGLCCLSDGGVFVCGKLGAVAKLPLETASQKFTQKGQGTLTAITWGLK